MPLRLALAGCGGFQLAEALSPVAEVFEPDVEIATFSSAAEARDAGTGQHHGVELSTADLADASVHVAAQRDDVQPEAERLQLGGAAPSRATRASRGSSRWGTAASTSRGSGAVGRSL